jgi:hypothetical protein
MALQLQHHRPMATFSSSRVRCSLLAPRPSLLAPNARLQQRKAIALMPLSSSSISSAPSRRRDTTVARASAAGGASPAPEEPIKPESSGVVPKIMDVFKVFSDPACNKKLLALAIGQMLCSVATLMHDSYLPVYVQDELGLSNTKVGIACFVNTALGLEAGAGTGRARRTRRRRRRRRTAVAT